MATECRICPGPQCVQGYHDASLSIRRWLRERVTATLSQPSRETLAAPKRHFVARRPDDAPAVDVRPAKPKRTPATFSQHGREMAAKAIERLAQGATYAQIAKEFDVSFAMIAKWMSLARKHGSEEMKATLDRLHHCPSCKAHKMPHAEKCNRCNRKAERSAA